MTQHHEAAENNGNADHEGTKVADSRRQFLGLAGPAHFTLSWAVAADLPSVTTRVMASIPMS